MIHHPLNFHLLLRKSSQQTKNNKKMNNSPESYSEASSQAYQKAVDICAQYRKHIGLDKTNFRDIFTVKKSKIRTDKLGLFTKKTIPHLHTIGPYLAVMVPISEYQKGSENQDYAIKSSDGRYIFDGSDEQGNPHPSYFQFIRNNDVDPNVKFEEITFNGCKLLKIEALRFIQPGEELTCDFSGKIRDLRKHFNIQLHGGKTVR